MSSTSSTFQSNSGVPGAESETAKIQKQNNVQEDVLNSTQHGTKNAELGIENTNIKTASGVSLSEGQKVVVGSILDVRLPLFPYPPSSLEIGLGQTGGGVRLMRNSYLPADHR